MTTFYAWIDRSFMPQVYDLDAEQKKLGLARILLGLFILIRNFEIWNFSHYLVPGFESHFFLLVLLASCLAYTVGLFTPLATLFIILLSPKVDGIYDANTLGTAILIQLLLVNLFVNGGQRISLDYWLLKKHPNTWLAKLLNKLYSFIGNPNEVQMRRWYFMGFLSYALVSLGAIGFHFQDQFWLNGETVSIFLATSFLSKYYPVFREFEASFPQLYTAFGAFAVIGQSIFQVLMIPLMYFRWGRFFVVIWGLGFFIASLFLIQLSYLPHIEVIFWCVLFYRFNPKKQLTLLYDDRCNLCKKSIRVLRFFNFNNSLKFSGISKSGEIAKAYELSEEEVKIWMYAIDDGEAIKGFDVYYRYVFRNPVLWLLIPVFILGKWTGLGYTIYGQIAKNRYKYFGKCELFYPAPEKEPEISNQRTNLATWAWRGYALVIFTYVLVAFPYIDLMTKKACHQIGLGKLPEYGFRYVYRCGFDMPHVFNEDDLVGNDRWFILYQVQEDGSKERVPIFGADGERLYPMYPDYFFFSNHGSDALYFGITARSRRDLVHRDLDSLDWSSYQGVEDMKRIAQFHLNFHQNQKAEYYFEIVENYMVRSKLNPGIVAPEKRYENKVVYSDSFTVANPQPDN